MSQLNTNQKKTVLKIGGMHCAGCVNSIQNRLLKLEGVTKCEVNLASEKATIEFEPTVTNMQKIENTIKSTGYNVVYEKLKLKVSGITDASDASGLENILKNHEGIKHVIVNYGNGQILAEYNSVLISLSDIRKILTKKGYQILSEDLSASAEEVEAKKTRKLFILGVMFTIPVVAFSHMGLLPVIPAAHSNLVAYFVFACASVVQFVIGKRFYLGAYRAARIRSANMDTLIVIGTTAAYLFSVFNTFPMPMWENIDYSAASVVITFILLGKYLESKTKGKSSSIIRKMLEIQPKTATVRKDNVETETPVELIQHGDTIVVKPGEKIPVDCIIIEGNSAVDESMVTGESIPKTKKAGDLAIGGTINKEGVLIGRATKVGSETFLAQVVNLVEEAMGRKPPMQKLVDKVAGYFAFIVVGIASVAFLTWFIVGAPGIVASALTPTVAILVVACPCALGLATPTAIMVGMGKAAQNGIIFKSGQGMELLGKIKTVVFDKTGTLTVGKPQVTNIFPLGEVAVDTKGRIVRNGDDLLQLTATIERNSEHPLAKSIVQKAKDLGIEIFEPTNFVSVPGRGVKAHYHDQSFIVGSHAMMKEEGIDIRSVTDSIDELQQEGKTVSLITQNKKLIGMIAFQDIPKPTALDAVRLLKKMGKEVIMLTGDNEKTALAIAKEIGIDHVIANVMPYDKVQEVEKLQSQGKKVAMVGDGINDAPALTQSDVGIAIGGGTDVTLEAGMVVLVKDNLKEVATAIEISKKTVSKIKQNLFYAFVYNIILIPVAGIGLLLPEFAGLAMAASSVSVVSSSLLLKRWTPPSKRNSSHVL